MAEQERKISDDLAVRFQEELRTDDNATLGTLRAHLRDVYERGPDEPARGNLGSLLSEVDELVVEHGEHAPLASLL